ncbi:uridine kinase [Streptomyces sp. NPDC006879]|uniref:uridine kinase n=1 Tax=Streptomyces sp. NPDC006879 TaxID=3364767 RepID=UPI0036B4F063
MRMESITWDLLADRLAAHLEGLDVAGPWLRVAVDGAPAAGTGPLAGALAEQLRVRGRPVLVAAADGFLRPASLRFEYGRQDLESYLDGWYDTAALWREVFDPTAPAGSGRVLPDLWDPARDRATRSPYVELPPGAVVVLHGPLLLRHWFPFDLSVHIRLSPGALARRTEERELWTLPAFARYEEEIGPDRTADVVVKADDPRHPAWSGVSPR